MALRLNFPQRLCLAITPTPLHPLDRLSEQLRGPRIWIKRDDLTGSVLSGNKVRKLEFLVAQASAEGCDTLITCGALQSNHCRATALVAAQLGMKAVLVLRQNGPLEPVDANLLLSQLAGAELRIYAEPAYRRDLPGLLARTRDQLLAQGHKPYLIPTGGSDAVGVWGYVAASLELQQAYRAQGIAPSHLICAVGSGGTLAGLAAGHALYSPGTRVLGMAVCDSAAEFQRKVEQDLADWRQRYGIASTPLSMSINDQYIGDGYGQAGAEVLDCIARLASLEGIVLDPVYTGKAFYGMLEEIRRGTLPSSGDLVFVHTGGIFGVFPYRQAMGRRIAPLA